MQFEAVSRFKAIHGEIRLHFVAVKMNELGFMAADGVGKETVALVSEHYVGLHAEFMADFGEAK